MKLVSCIALLSILSMGPAIAKPPNVGSVGPIDQPMIVCETHEQMDAIVKAFKEDKLSEQMNGPDQPCVFLQIPVAVTITKSEYQGKLTGRDKVIAITAKLWIVTLTMPGQKDSAYVLWGETADVESAEEWQKDE